MQILNSWGKTGAMEATTAGQNAPAFLQHLEASAYPTWLQCIIQLVLSLKCLSAVIQTYSLFTPVIAFIDAFPIAISFYLFMSFYFSARSHIILISSHSTSSNPPLLYIVCCYQYSILIYFLIWDKNIVSSLLCSDKRNVIFWYGNYSVIHMNIQEICFLYWKEVFFYSIVQSEKTLHFFNMFSPYRMNLVLMKAATLTALRKEAYLIGHGKDK